MSTPPLVLVPCDVRHFDGYDWHAAPQTYISALASAAGAQPLLLPALGDAAGIETALAACHGVLLTGSRSNVHPGRYGTPAQKKHEPFDEARDETALMLVRAALKAGLPLLAICRGMQELNVALGGTIAAEIQDCAGRFDHRAPQSEDADERFRLAHSVQVRTGGRLGAILGTGEIRVNSLHRQAIDTLAPGLAVEATAGDGTIEAVSVEGANAFALAVQWHPEYWAGSDPPSGKLFAAFGKACRVFRDARARTA